MQSEDAEKIASVWSRDGNVYANQHNGMIVVIKSFANIDAPPIDLVPNRGKQHISGHYTPKH